MGTKILYIALVWLICVNVIGFIMAGLDKLWAIRRQWRLAEKWFFTMTVIGSGFGIFLGCLVFHHKIRNRAFMLGIPFIILTEAGLGIVLVHFLTRV